MKMYRRQIRLPSSAVEKKRPSIDLAGSVHTFILGILLVVFVAGGGYLYSVNRSAVQGYHLRTLEKEISKLRQENAELKIVEADLRSLYRIEASAEALAMQKAEDIVYLERSAPLTANLSAAVALIK